MRSDNYNLPGAEEVIPQVIMELDYYTEGPVVDEEGHLFFTDLAGQNIWLFKDGTAKIWAKGVRPNGQALMVDGSLVVCDSVDACLVHYDLGGQIQDKLGSGFIGNTRVRCPNDLAIDSHQGIYFTDSVRHEGAVFFIGFSGEEKLVADKIDFANGIALSPDGQRIFVAESYRNRILVMDLHGPGVLKNVQVFADLPINEDNPETGNLPDGMAFDPMGRLWVAHYGMKAVQVLSASGDLLATYNTGIPLTSNLCFMDNDVIVTGGFGEPGPGRVSRLPIF